MAGRTRCSWLLALGPLLVLGCTDARDQPVCVGASPATTFEGVVATKVLAGGGGWLVLTEKLQRQLLVTVPQRTAAMLDADLAIVRSFEPIDGWTLIDATLHPSGEVTAIFVRVDYADTAFPEHILLARYRRDGTRVDAEIGPVGPSDPTDLGAVFVASYDRVRAVARGEDVYVAARWPGNAVYVYRFTFEAGTYHQDWATLVEPEAEVSILGIIGGGFDNFHQGDNEIFVYLDVDAAGDAHVAVASSPSVLPRHDAAFGDGLMAGADPANLDFGTAILTRLDERGRRVHARLLGVHGRRKSLLSMRAGEGLVLLTGRVKTGDTADAWDAWIVAADAETGATRFESTVDVEQGDAFWDAAPLPGGQVVAVGATGYTQNPSGLSVSDARKALAVLLDSRGRLVRRLAVPSGTGERGDEVLSLHVQGCRLALAGMLDGPGTHAEVRANGFVQTSVLDTP